MKAQLQISFQWILVIVGGGMLLAIIWFLLRGTTEGAEQTSDALSIRNAGTFISGTAWQPDTRVNKTMPAMTVSCDGDVVTLNGKSSKYPLAGVPAFLPPQLAGDTVITTASWKRPLPLGSHLYALDRNTKLVFLDPSGAESAQALRILQLSTRDPRVLMLSTLNEVSNQQFSSELHTIIIIAFNSDPFTAVLPPNARMPQAENVVGVFVKRIAGDDKRGNLTFYKFANGRFSQQAKTTFSTSYLLAGAMVTGDSVNYLCGKQVVERRAKYVTQVAKRRLDRLTLNPTLAAECAPLIDARDLMGSIANTQEIIARLQQEETRIKALDDTLIAKGCPGIA